MVIAFTGDPFLAREALLEEARLRGLSRFTEPTPEALAEALTPGLFGGAGAMLDLREVGEGEWKALKPLLEGVPEGVPVLLLDPRPTPARAAFYRGRERRDFPTPRGKDLLRHLEGRAKRLGLKLPAGVVQYLASLEGDLEALERELEKLALLAPPLTLEKVERVVALRPPVTGFDLVRAALEGNAPEALRRLQRLKEEGEEPLKLLGAFAWQVALLARAWMLLGETPRPKEEDLARLEAHPYAARRALEMARGLGKEGLRQALDTLIAAERRAKEGKDPWLALEGAVLALAGLSLTRGSGPG
ncbi:DNA polymerase III, delta subunit [Thermus sp. CCB_US3_UF1]|uniref:DNA polymerase III subunit delta n=1 Tax=unclassified Thermus TaxID=2619321 RepID=UPI0002389370|nr:MULTISPECIES: DNA polymerase III subunit delta [unclassified Thermus]AEV16659.1 DNA polymerase III, delta subunit [Thermus sp. CCB_US3_UF1]MDW8356706.1 DNA polymerase III subunit delta [Thermus sp.]